MKHKSIAVAFITFLICMVLGNGIACTTPVTEYVLNISSTEGGEVTEPGEGTYPYCQEQGEKVNLVAPPYVGYRFVNWTGDVEKFADVNKNRTSITMKGHYSITANFEEIPEDDEEIPEHDLTISSTAGGNVTSPGEGLYTCHAGSVVDLACETEEDYRFVNWSGDVDTMADVNTAATNITMYGNYTIMANFQRPVNYDLITGVVAAVVIAGAVILFMLRREKES